MMCKKSLAVYLVLLIVGIAGTKAQDPATQKKPAKDTGKIVKLIKADKYKLIKQDTSGELHMLVGNVLLLHGKTWFSCDSAIQDTRLNQVEAFGNVHINDADSVHTYSQYLKYLGDTRIAYLSKQVRLTDGKGTLTTEDLEYDLNAKIGTYKNHGKVVNESSVLTSKEGYYYADDRDVYFKGNVRLVDPEYTVASDTLLYNIDSEIATFVAATTINDGKSTIRTRSGYYDLKNGVASFGNRPIIEDSSQQIIADAINYDKKSGEGEAEGNVVYKDTAQGVSILAGYTKFSNTTKKVLATIKPVMILKQDNDSLFVAADTLYSAMGSETKFIPKIDSVTHSPDSSGTKSDSTLIPSDSSNFVTNPTQDTLHEVKIFDTKGNDSIRYFEAYHNVRIFSDSLQGVCDSLAYSSKDSVFRMYFEPVLWAKESQVTGDTIYLFTKNKKADQVFVFENGFSINKTKENFYNQVKGRRINGIFIDGELDYVRAKGNAESVYYLQDEDSAYVGVNYASADAISMYFEKRELKRVTWVSGVEGTTYPMREIPDDRKQLRNFKWLENRRPKTRMELFE
jgi:lipopolysaccharide export system protein LptA